MFDRERFMSMNFVPREADVPVPELKDYFGPDDSPVWRVRGLTGYEVGRVNEAVLRNQNLTAVFEGIASGIPAEITSSVRELYGKTVTPGEVAKRIEQLIIGSVSPVVDLDLAVKVCTAFPVQVWFITNKILSLTGMGHEPGKPMPSGMTQGSGPA